MWLLKLCDAKILENETELTGNLHKENWAWLTKNILVWENIDR